MAVLKGYIPIVHSFGEMYLLIPEVSDPIGYNGPAMIYHPVPDMSYELENAQIAFKWAIWEDVPEGMTIEDIRAEPEPPQ